MSVHGPECHFTIYYGVRVEVKYPCSGRKYSYRTNLTQLGALTAPNPNDPENTVHQEIVDQLAMSDGDADICQFGRLVATNPLHLENYFLDRIETGLVKLLAVHHSHVSHCYCYYRSRHLCFGQRRWFRYCYW